MKWFTRRTPAVADDLARISSEMHQAEQVDALERNRFDDLSREALERIAVMLMPHVGSGVELGAGPFCGLEVKKDGIWFRERVYGNDVKRILIAGSTPGSTAAADSGLNDVNQHVVHSFRNRILDNPDTFVSHIMSVMKARTAAAQAETATMRRRLSAPARAAAALE